MNIECTKITGFWPNPYADVSSGRGVGGRQRHQFCWPERYGDRVFKSLFFAKKYAIHYVSSFVNWHQARQYDHNWKELFDFAAFIPFLNREVYTYVFVKYS